MNTVLVGLWAAFSSVVTPGAQPAAAPTQSVFSAAISDIGRDSVLTDWISSRLGLTSSAAGRHVIRGQNPMDPSYDSAPQSQSSSAAQTYVQGDPNQPPIQGPMLGQPYPAPMPYDPFNGGGYDPLAIQGAPPGLEYYDPYSREFQIGLLGSQPYRLGWGAYHDVGYIFKEPTSGVSGSFSVIESNHQWKNSIYLPSGAIFSWKPEFNYRGWSGPDGVPMPADAYRFASDIEIGAQGPSPWGFQLGFTPQLATDFDKQLNSNAWLWDGRAMLFYKADPTLMLVGGVGYWDRVQDRIIPYAGVVWTPDDRWELRLLFPKSRISVLISDCGCMPVWLYGTFEYNVEAYQVGLSTLNRGDQVQIADYRALVGLRTSNGSVASFIEGGYVFDRKVDFRGPTPDFNINDGWMIRLGVQY